MEERIVAVYQDEVNASRMNYSCVSHFEGSRSVANSISIKYVIHGHENYEFQHRQYCVEQHHYLLIDKGNSYTGNLQSKELNCGLCVYIDSVLTSDILFSLSNKEECALDNPQDYHSVSLDVTEGYYNGKVHTLGRQLKKLAVKASLAAEGKDNISREDMITIAEYLVRDQLKVGKLVQRVPAKQLAVQREIYKRMETARDYIMERLNHPIGINELAELVHMSPYHFMRSFKSVYKLSAYQFIQEQRLQLACRLIRQQKWTLTEIAAATGFIDLFTFSKAFKKRFGKAPRFFIL